MRVTVHLSVTQFGNRLYAYHNQLSEYLSNNQLRIVIDHTGNQRGKGVKDSK